MNTPQPRPHLLALSIAAFFLLFVLGHVAGGIAERHERHMEILAYAEYQPRHLHGATRWLRHGVMAKCISALGLTGLWLVALWQKSPLVLPLTPGLFMALCLAMMARMENERIATNGDTAADMELHLALGEHR